MVIGQDTECSGHYLNTVIKKHLRSCTCKYYFLIFITKHDLFIQSFWVFLKNQKRIKDGGWRKKGIIYHTQCSVAVCFGMNPIAPRRGPGIKPPSYSPKPRDYCPWRQEKFSYCFICSHLFPAYKRCAVLQRQILILSHFSEFTSTPNNRSFLLS